ncbi:MAG: MYXO-CTERM sorting domain-containing protein [Polyangiales bacterium]
MFRRPLALVALAAALVSSAPEHAQANGRFPQANYLVVGPGLRNDLIVLRTTFGLVFSNDLGAHWDWVCEEALDAVGSFDPSIAIGSDRRVTLGLPMGMRVSSEGFCRWTVPTGAAASVTDVTQDALGEVILATGTVYGGPTPVTQVLRSDDRGQSWRITASLPEFIVETIDVAPGAPQRVYLSGYRPGAVGTIMRSDDGGANFRVTTARFPDLASVWIAAVDPTRPDRLWLRVAADLGTQLYRSDDGAASTVMVARTPEPMDGFALSSDGETVWYGTANRSLGIFRSQGGGPFTRVAGAASVRCMRFHDGVLFICADEATDGYSLAWTTDGADTLHPLMSVRDLRGPVAGCSGGDTATAMCASPWAQFGPQLRDLDAATTPPRVPLPPRDAGAIDAGATDAEAADVGGADVPIEEVFDAVAPDALDAGAAVADLPPAIDVRDAGSHTDSASADLPRLDAPSLDARAMDRPLPSTDQGAPAPPPSSCACRSAGAASPRGALALALAALGLRPRSRRRRGARRPESLAR